MSPTSIADVPIRKTHAPSRRMRRPDDTSDARKRVILVLEGLVHEVDEEDRCGERDESKEFGWQLVGVVVAKLAAHVVHRLARDGEAETLGLAVIVVAGAELRARSWAAQGERLRLRLAATLLQEMATRSTSVRS